MASQPVKKSAVGKRPAAKRLKAPSVDFSDMCIVIVGKDKMPFFIPEATIRQSSPYLTALLDDGIRTSGQASKTIELISDATWMTELNFNLYANWIIRKKLDTLTRPYDDDGIAYAAICAELSQLWIMGAFLGTSSFTDFVEKELEACAIHPHWLPTLHTVDEAWTKCEPGSWLQEYVLRRYLRWSPTTATLRKVNSEFLFDLCARALLDLNAFH